MVVAIAAVEVVDEAVTDFNEADFDRVFGVNTKGAAFTLQRAAKDVGDDGRIIYVGSSTTVFPTPGHGPYGASKIALSSWLKCWPRFAPERGERRTSSGRRRPSVTPMVDHIILALTPGLPPAQVSPETRFSSASDEPSPGP